MEPKEIKQYLDQIRSLERESIEIKRKLIQSNSLDVTYQTDGQNLSFVLIQVQDKSIAIPVPLIIEIVGMVELIPSIKSIFGVAGNLNYHGEILSTVDIGEIMGLSKLTVTPEKYLAICSISSIKFALPFDDIVGLETVKLKEIRIEEEVLPGSLKAIGIIQAGDHSAVIIDLWSILLSVQVGSFEGHTSQLDDK